MNKIVLIGLLLVGFQANVEQKILLFFRFVQRLFLSGMFIVGLSITPINAAVIQVSFTGPTFDRVDDNEYFHAGGTFGTNDFVSGFFSFNDDDLIVDEYGNLSKSCSNCFDVDNFRASAGLISISDSDVNAALNGSIYFRNDIPVFLSLFYTSGNYVEIGDVRKYINYTWGYNNYHGLTTRAGIEECTRRRGGVGNCNSFNPLLGMNILANASGSDLTFSLEDAVLNGYLGAPVFAVSTPSNIALLTLGFVGIGFARRRRS
jgi:hypothetical protein